MDIRCYCCFKCNKEITINDMYKFLCNECCDVLYLSPDEITNKVNSKTVIDMSRADETCDVCLLFKTRWVLYNDKCGYFMNICPQCCDRTLQAKPYGFPYIDEKNWEIWYYCSMPFKKESNKHI